MSSVDIMGQKTAAYRFSCKSSYRFYLRMFFDLINVSHVDSHIVYMEVGDIISLLNFKIVVAKALIGKYSDCKRLVCQTNKNLMNHLSPEK